jgi:hypothetical protein
MRTFNLGISILTLSKSFYDAVEKFFTENTSEIKNKEKFIFQLVSNEESENIIFVSESSSSDGGNLQMTYTAQNKGARKSKNHIEIIFSSAGTITFISRIAGKKKYYYATEHNFKSQLTAALNQLKRA